MIKLILLILNIDASNYQKILIWIKKTIKNSFKVRNNSLIYIFKLDLYILYIMERLNRSEELILIQKIGLLDIAKDHNVKQTKIYISLHFAKIFQIH